MMMSNQSTGRAPGPIRTSESGASGGQSSLRWDEDSQSWQINAGQITRK